MKLIFILIPVLTSGFLYGQSEQDRLLYHTWQFTGYEIKGEPVPAPDDFNYTLIFEKNSWLTGKARLRYWGRYKIKNRNRIKIQKLGINKTFVSHKYPGEFEWRMKYARCLDSRRPVDFDVTNDSLRLKARDGVVMLYKRKE